MKLNRKKYITEFKRELVILVINQGYSYVEAVRILKINTTTAARGE